MNVARFETFEEMLASILSSGRGIICGRDQNENAKMLESCVESVRRDFAKSSGIAYIGFTHKGQPFCADHNYFRNVADISECVFQMHISHESGTYRAILMR